MANTIYDTDIKDSCPEILIMSKYNYLFLCIPDPDNHLIKRMEQLFFEFIWDNKPDKIKRNTLCMDNSSETVAYVITLLCKDCGQNFKQILGRYSI